MADDRAPKQPELESSQFWPANFQRNQAFLLPSAPTVYNTPLQPPQEAAFRQWVTANQVPFNPALPVSDYDMRGFWQALQQGDPRAASAVDPNDQRLHYPDYWKTPYAATFSAESQWANPAVAPRWQGDLYQLPNGQVLWDDRAQRWVGPNAPWGPDAMMSLMMQQRGVDPVIQALMRGQPISTSAPPSGSRNLPAVPGTADNPLIQPGPGGAPVGARDVPGSLDRNRFWNPSNIAPYSPPGVPDDRLQMAGSLLGFGGAEGDQLNRPGLSPETVMRMQGATPGPGGYGWRSPDHYPNPGGAIRLQRMYPQFPANDAMNVPPDLLRLLVG